MTIESRVHCTDEPFADDFLDDVKKWKNYVIEKEYFRVFHHRKCLWKWLGGASDTPILNGTLVIATARKQREKSSRFVKVNFRVLCEDGNFHIHKSRCSARRKDPRDSFSDLSLRFLFTAFEFTPRRVNVSRLFFLSLAPTHGLNCKTSTHSN